MIEVTVKIKFKGQEIEATLDECRELRQALEALEEKKVKIEQVFIKEVETYKPCSPRPYWETIPDITTWRCS